MNIDKDLDKLKEFWKNQESIKGYSQNELLLMLNKKSSNNVKYIVIISIIEFIIVILSLFVTTSDSGILKSLDEHTKEIYIQNYKISKFLLYCNAIISFFFIYFFYKSYKNINIVCSVKDLINNILKFRKNVNIFIYINIAFGFLYIFLTGFYDFVFNVRMATKMKSINSMEIDKIYTPFDSQYYFVLFVMISLLIIIVMVVYYLIVYGIILRRLKRNLVELRRIEYE